MITDEELKIIAQDFHSEKIFSDRHLRNPETELPMVFMALIFMEKKHLKDFKPVFIYEYLDKAIPGSINGYPMFMSMRTLNQEDFDKMWDYYEKIKSSIDSALKD